MSTTVIVTFTVKQESLAAFKDILNGVKTDLPKVHGCKSVQVFNKSDEPCVFTLVESWSSVDDHKTHIAGVIASGGWDRIAAHLARDPISGYFEQI